MLILLRSVLVVDDSMFMRKLIITYLKRNGYVIVGEACNGKEAVVKYSECHPDIVTMDITMPVMSGLEALSEIMKADQNAKVVMVTSMGQEFMVMEALKNGAKNFMVKPFSERSVVDSLDIALNKE